MATMTIRLPDAKHERLRRLAERHGVSLNKLVDEWASMALAQFDAETRFLHPLSAWERPARTIPAGEVESKRTCLNPPVRGEPRVDPSPIRHQARTAATHRRTTAVFPWSDSHPA